VLDLADPVERVGGVRVLVTFEGPEDLADQ